MLKVITENVTVVDEFMTGQQRILDRIAQQNNLNNSMPWQRTAGGSVPENKPGLFVSGSRTIFGGMQDQDDKIIKLWELSIVDAVDNIYNGVLMWWPAIS